MPRRLDYTDRFRTDVSYNPRRAVANDNSPPSGANVTTAQILALVDRATSSERHSPDYALNLQIADFVNEKKGNSAREVAMKLAKLAGYPIYGRRGILALSVLDVCVKNCGYPFHLAISRRDFLNMLVRPFGLNPPLHYSHLQNVILGMLQEWDLGLVRHSKYRDDLSNINEMTRLLQRKGYIFPEVSQADVAALRPTDDSLKSAAELAAEDREIQSAKLQELIRSGTPEDLQEANRLMSLMAGFRESRVDYHAKMAAELDKVRRKAYLFAELLTQADPSTLNGDVITDLCQSLKSSVPKIKHILSDQESMEEDEEAHKRILELQKTVDTVLAQYVSLKSNGTVDAPAPAPAQDSLASLIDIGDEPEPPKHNDDLLGLGGLSLETKPVTTADILRLNAGQSATPVASSTSSFISPTASTTTTTTQSVSLSNPAASVDPFAAFESTMGVERAGTSPSAEDTFLFSDETVKITYTANNQPNSTEMKLKITNVGTKKITNLESQFAPPKSWRLELGALTSTQLEPSGVLSQQVKLVGTGSPKLRWRLNYRYGLDQKTVGGDVKNIQ